MKSIKQVYALLALMFLIFACNTKPCKTISTSDYEAQGHIISLEQAKSMHENYGNRLKPVVEQKQRLYSLNGSMTERSYKGTEYVWISLEHLKDYITFLEEVEKKNKATKQPKITGVAIYLAAYNTDYNAALTDISTKLKHPRSGDYKGRETIFLNPTYDTNTNDAFDVLDQIPFKIIPSNDTDKYLGKFTPFEEISFAKNNSRSESTTTNTTGTIEGTSLADDLLLCVPPQ